MTEQRECARCGRELPDPHEVSEYPIPKPVKRGEFNPVVAYGMFAVANTTFVVVDRSTERVTWDIETGADVATCPDCEPPTSPPRSSLDTHFGHAVLASITTYASAVSFSTPEVATLEAAFTFFVCGALLLGELYQINRHVQTSDRDLMLDAHEAEREEDVDPVEAARDAYLRGDIDEDELEERLAAHYGDDEHDREKRVVER